METFKPTSTYRIQFHQGFTFREAERLLPYLVKLGIGAIYASPVFAAVPGSLHGYDVVDPLHINPEIGTLQQLRALARKFKAKGIAWIQDIVPNHMAFHPKNQWLMDVLEKGKQSTYASFFDTPYSTEFFEGRLMVPFLGDPLDQVVDKGELSLVLQDHRFQLAYADQRYPVNRESYLWLLDRKQSDNQIPKPILKALEAASADFYPALKEALKEPAVAKWLKNVVDEVNTDKEVLKALADRQHYALTYWAETDQRINYRRFFTVNSLICLNMQDEQVFGQYHQLIKQLTDEGIFKGLRVDHVDGLYDPAQYLQRLRLLVGPSVYLVVEKILETGEDLPISWPIQGTTGYDFLAQVNNLFTASAQEIKFDRFYRRFTGDKEVAAEQAWVKKEHFLYSHMQGELDNLYRLLERAALVPKKDFRLIGESRLKQSIAKLLVYCPVYRYYGDGFPLRETEARELLQLFEQLRAKFTDLTEPLAFLQHVLLKPEQLSRQKKKKVLVLYQRLMQFSGPLMAKGVEDTLMYTYNRFIAHNEVGDTPTAFGISVKAFHNLMEKRQQRWPQAMNATSTHDTKRGEDVRMRLNVLSEWPKIWKDNVLEWDRVLWEETDMHPDACDRYFLYQTLVGAWPLLQQDIPSFRERMDAYIEKALREAKRHSNWTEPDEAYEMAAKKLANRWIDWQLASAERQEWLDEVADFGLFNSLGQLLMKMMAPGVPDIYQGNEGWDFSLVDPDNRRPVDFGRLASLLKEKVPVAVSRTALLELWEERKNGGIKGWLTQQLLACRNASPELLAKGRYIPLRVRGRYRKEVIAFARQYRDEWLVVILPVHIARLCADQKVSVSAINWKNTRIDWPMEAPKAFRHLLTGQEGHVDQEALLLKDCFGESFPLAVLVGKEKISARGAGVLLAVSSLPGPFGIGDIGPQARRFVEFLKAAKQQYWQLLPLSPSGQKEFYSPYSAYAAMAGNPLYISLEGLVAAGWLSAGRVKELFLPESDQVDYEQAAQIKERLLQEAYEGFNRVATDVQQVEFAAFTVEEQDWLDDFALYLVLKTQFKGQAWHAWPAPYRDREKASLDNIRKEKQQQLLFIKWQQYLFSKQWRELKGYANGLGIQLFGDLPFYVNHDSVDVWAHRELFALDAAGNMQQVAGVPPDYFNAEGQLWGMPVFRWDVLKHTGYRWWVNRVRKNMELFDLLRLDHFRAFYNYWQVPGGENTAIAGEWALGPGKAIFDVFREALGKLPFVAEDLGDIHPEVYALRNAIRLPGMKVLQFAFGPDMPDSLHVPHQHERPFVVYTGTHDNNTVAGWYRQELKDDDRARLQQYLGKSLKGADIPREMIRLAYASVANVAIIPMQDILGLDESSRMNTPATVENNWRWRLKEQDVFAKLAIGLRELAYLYGR